MSARTNDLTEAIPDLNSSEPHTLRQEQQSRNMSLPDPDMPRVNVPRNLPDLVKAAFNKARSNGDLSYYPTQVTLLNINSIPFQLRFSPALANKPKPPPSAVADKKPFNPFAEPSPALLITPVSIESQPTHNLVLNKFAIVPEHFILSTKELKPQTHLLEAEDLEVAHRCIRLYEDAGRELFVFFNSGEGSGASQEHRHLQLLDVENMRDGLPADGGWDVLAKRLGRGEGLQQALPFWTVGAILPPDPTGQTLREIYLDLYKQAALKVLGEGAKAVTEMDEEGEAMISYNLAMTKDTMVIVPRTAEGGSVRDAEGREVGWLALNGTVLAGTALVKTEAEWDALRQDPGQVGAVLGRIGVRNDGVVAGCV